MSIHNLCMSSNMKNITENFSLKTFSFCWRNFSIYLNRRVFVMDSQRCKFFSCAQWRLIRLHGCAGWLASALSAHIKRFIFWTCVSFVSYFLTSNPYVCNAPSWQPRRCDFFRAWLFNILQQTDQQVRKCYILVSIKIVWIGLSSASVFSKRCRLTHWRLETP